MEKIYKVNSVNDIEYSHSTDVFFTEEDARDYIESTISEIKKDFEEEYGLKGAPGNEYFSFTIIALNRDYSWEVIDSITFKAEKGAREIKILEQKG